MDSRWMLYLPAYWMISIPFAFGAGPVLAQTQALPVIEGQSPAPAWSFSATAEFYFPGASQNFVQPTFTADTDRLHLEARYNGEALGATSAWVGYNLSAGDQLTVGLTAMAGAVFGTTRGYAPGYEVTLKWKRFQLYSEGEYVFDTKTTSDSYFYTWSELTLAPSSWFQYGMVIQRTKVYQGRFDIQRGVLVRFTHEQIDLSGYVLDPGTAQPTYVLATSVSF